MNNLGLVTGLSDLWIRFFHSDSQFRGAYHGGGRADHPVERSAIRGNKSRLCMYSKQQIALSSIVATVKMAVFMVHYQ